MSEMKLKPCPFCGGKAWLINAEAGKDGMGRHWRNPRCRECGADLGYCKTPEAAAKAWNTRPGETRLVEALEAARLIFKDTLEWNAIVHIDSPTVSIGNIIDAALADVKEPQP